MLSSLYTGVSGMGANGTSLSVIGDNIANMNTIGFKSSRANFGDLVSQSLGAAGGSSQVGRGVMARGVEPILTQGSFETTANGLDLAVDGDGFFIVRDGSSSYYTRAGQFSLDKSGNIVNPDGLILQGYLADASGNINSTGSVTDLLLGTAQSLANATTLSTISVNLDSSVTAPAGAFTLDSNGDGNFNDPANYNHSTSMTVYDSQGGAHNVTIYFVKTAANAWTAHYAIEDPANAGEYMEAGQTTGGAGLVPTGAATTQNLTFDANGALTADNSATAMVLNLGGAAGSVSVNFNYGTSVAEGGTGLDGATQFISNFSVRQVSQDGYSSGFLKSVSISEDGYISGIFTNGQTRHVGRVALARFVAPTELNKQGRNLFSETFDSGQATINAADTSGLGRTLANTLELSNVDLAAEFVSMITAQRGFQANSRVITTSDEMLQEMLNLKR